MSQTSFLEKYARIKEQELPEAYMLGYLLSTIDTMCGLADSHFDMTSQIKSHLRNAQEMVSAYRQTKREYNQ